MDNVLDTVASQYGNSPTLLQLIDNMNQYFDPAADFDAFYNFVWNVDTAQGFGLDVWGKIVNVSRELSIPGTLSYLGFAGVDGAQPFGQSTFYTSNPTQTYVLEDDVFRVLIMAKALYNISGGTPASINQLLANLFPGRGRCYVLENGTMKIRFVFEFLLKPFEAAIMSQSGAIPRPAGVDSDILQVDVPNTFGFSEASAQPFGSGVFFYS